MNKHHCHHPTCDQSVPPKLFACLKHWRMLPADIKSEIWATYKPGQEITKTPSPEYLKAARRAQDFYQSQLKAKSVKIELDQGTLF